MSSRLRMRVSRASSSNIKPMAAPSASTIPKAMISGRFGLIGFWGSSRWLDQRETLALAFGFEVGGELRFHLFLFQLGVFLLGAL